ITATGTTLTLGCNPTADQINAALGTATATDKCGPVTPTPSDGTVTSNGCSRSQTRTWTATDACSNAATPVSRTVTWTEDTTGPTFSGCPTSPINLGCNPTPPSCMTVAGLGITANDNCSGSITPSCSASSVQMNGCQRSQTFTLTATDGCSNSSTCQVTFTW